MADRSRKALVIDGGLVIVWEVLSNFVVGLELALRLRAALNEKF